MALKISTRCLLAQSIFLYAVVAHSATEPDAVIAACRARHAESPTEHIACLERELRLLGGSQAAPPPSLGSEQLRTNRPKETVGEIAVEIQNVTYGFDGRGLFNMTDGQVWKGTESTPGELRLESGKKYSARIERGKLGGYRMYIDGAPRMIKVMRVQ